MEVRNADEILTPDEIAAELKIPKSFLYAPARRKGADPFPFFRVGKYLRARRGDSYEWIARRNAQ